MGAALGARGGGAALAAPAAMRANVKGGGGGALGVALGARGGGAALALLAALRRGMALPPPREALVTVGGAPALRALTQSSRSKASPASAATQGTARALNLSSSSCSARITARINLRAVPTSSSVNLGMLGGQSTTKPPQLAARGTAAHSQRPTARAAFSGWTLC